MIDTIYTFNDFLWKEIQNKSNESNLEELGKQHFLTLRDYYFDIKHLLFDDLKKLHEIKKFLNHIKANRDYYSYKNR